MDEGVLRVGSVIVWYGLEQLDSELVAVFRDDMLEIRRVLSEQYGYEMEPDHPPGGPAQPAHPQTARSRQQKDPNAA